MSKSLSLKIPKQSKLREAAEDILIYERVVLKRWLREHDGFEMNREQDIEYLVIQVRKQGGNPELLRSGGRDWGVKMLCETKGYY